MALNNSEKADKNIDKNKKQDNESLKTKFINDFLWEKTSDDKYNLFLNSLFENDSISDVKWLNQEMEKFQAYNKEFESLDIKTINIFNLRESLSRKYYSLHFSQKNLKEHILKEYSISNEWFKKINLDKKIKELSSIEISKLLNSETDLESFFIQKIWVKLSKRSDLFPLKEIYSSEQKQKEALERIENESNKDELLAILSDAKNWRIVSSDIKTLLNSKLFEENDKKNFVNTFIPYISLKDAIDFWFLTKKEAEIEREKILSTVIDDKKNISKIAETINLSNFKIETERFLNWSYDISKIINEIWFEKFEKDFKKIKDDYELNEDIDEVTTESWEKIKSVSSLSDLSKALWKINKNNRFQNLEKLKDDSIIELTYLDDWVKNKKYLKLRWNDEKSFKSILVWNDSKISIWKDDYDSELVRTWYLKFLSDLQERKDISINVFSEKELEDEIENVDSNFSAYEYKRLKDKDWDLTEKDKEYYKENYYDILESDVIDLEYKLSKTNNKDNEELKAELDYKKNLLDYYNNDFENNFLDALDFQRFVEKIDEFDPKWKNFLFKKDTFFKSEKWIFSIDWIDYSSWTITLRNAIWVLEWPISYEDFFEEFKKQKSKRLEYIWDFWKYFDKKSTIDSNWSNYIFEDWKLKIKELDKNVAWENSKSVDFLCSSKDDTVIKINSIDWDKVNIQFWERKWYNELTEAEKAKIKKWKDDSFEKISLDDKDFTISLNQLDDLINESELYPSWSLWKNYKTEEPLESENKFEWKFSTRLFNRYSFKEIIAWWTMFIEWFKESLKTSNDLHAAKVALAMWAILPEEIQEDLRIKVERAEADEMDKALENLGKVDSPIATKRILWWLQNKDTPEHKKEAWILFMLDKYWHLTSKWPLYPYRWKWLWYEALGWKIWDNLFNSVKEEARAWDITFSEEYLVHILLKKQCAWRAKPKRRSRLHKEYEWKWKNWIKEEFDKWYWDAEKKRTAKAMVDGWNDELTWGTTSNAIWWYKKAIERWWSLEDMSEWFFAMLYSGCLYDIDQATFLKIKSIWDEWMPIIPIRFSTTKSDMLLFNKVILELSKKIEDSYWSRFSWIYSKAQDLYNDALSWKWDEKDRVKRALDFWKEYSKPLSNALNLSNNDSSEFDKTDKVIFLEKNENPIFKEYLEKVRWFTTEWSFKDVFMNDACWQVWLTWLNVEELTKLHLWVSQNNNFRDEKTGNNVWNEIQKDLLSINSKRFYDDDVKDRKAKEYYLLNIFNDLLSWIFAKVGWKLVWTYNNNQMNMWKYFNSIWLKLVDDFWNFAASDFSNWEKNLNSKSNKKLLNVINNILDWKVKNMDDMDENNFNPLSDVEYFSKKAVDETLTNNSDYLWEDAS